MNEILVHIMTTANSSGFGAFTNEILVTFSIYFILPFVNSSILINTFQGVVKILSFFILPDVH
ncbi:TPA: hypothetical protein ACHIWX_002731 [Staphylococcus aureus]